jgi:translation initiation factor 3 subunit D
LGEAYTCGDVYKYEADLDKSRTYKPTGLIGKMENEPTIYCNTPTLEDPIIRKLAQENKADIFATEVAVAAIMTAPKSLYSWDVQIKKYQDKLFIDKRDDLNMLDYLTVNETSHESQPLDDDTVNGVRQIMDEARRVQDRILYQ